MNPSMTSSEITMVSNFLSGAVHYAEFGSGGSTCLACKFPNLRSIVSIESDHAFQQKVQGLCPRASVRWINIGKTADYGHPSDDSSKHLWRNYSTADIGNPDLILIDGRFRLACGIQCCLKYPDAIIMIHDFAHRTEYHLLLRFLDVFDATDSLVAARVKPGLDKTLLAEMFEAVVFDQN